MINGNDFVDQDVDTSGTYFYSGAGHQLEWV